MTSDPWSHGKLCVAGREGSWTGRPRWTDRASRFEGSFQIFCDFVSHHMCHSPQTNYGLISGWSRPSWITWSSRATGETWWYWATRSERWNWTVWTSWSTRKCGWCSCWMFFYVNPAAWISDCFWFQGVQGFTGSPGKAGPPGPPGPPGQAVSLYYTLRTTGWDVKFCLFSSISNHVLDQLENNQGREVEVCLRRLSCFCLLGLSWHWWSQRQQGDGPRQHLHPFTCLNVNKFCGWAHIIFVARGKLVSAFLVPEERGEIQDSE